jgi:hypothetical protein
MPPPNRFAEEPKVIEKKVATIDPLRDVIEAKFYTLSESHNIIVDNSYLNINSFEQAYGFGGNLSFYPYKGLVFSGDASTRYTNHSMPISGNERLEKIVIDEMNERYRFSIGIDSFYYLPKFRNQALTFGLSVTYADFTVIPPEYFINSGLGDKRASQRGPIIPGIKVDYRYLFRSYVLSFMGAWHLDVAAKDHAYDYAFDVKYLHSSRFNVFGELFYHDRYNKKCYEDHSGSCGDVNMSVLEMGVLVGAGIDLVE